MIEIVSKLKELSGNSSLRFPTFKGFRDENKNEINVGEI